MATLVFLDGITSETKTALAVSIVSHHDCERLKREELDSREAKSLDGGGGLSTMIQRATQIGHLIKIISLFLNQLHQLVKSLVCLSLLFR